MKQKKNHIIIASCFLLLSFLFALFLVKNIPFQTWAFERHQNLLSWYIRPVLIVPIMYFSYKRQIVGVTASIFALLTSMIWFPVPSETPALVSASFCKRLGAWKNISSPFSSSAFLSLSCGQPGCIAGSWSAWFWLRRPFWKWFGLT